MNFYKFYYFVNDLNDYSKFQSSFCKFEKN